MLRRAWRSPIVHFIVLGAMLLGIARLWSARHAAPSSSSLRQPIVIDAARIRALADGYRKDAGAPPTPAQLEGLVRDAVDDELLYREARRDGLDVGDRRIALRLAQKMRALSDDPRLDDAALERAARALGLDDDLVVRRLLQDKLRRRLGVDRSAPPPSDDELQAYLERHRGAYLTPATISFTHVFLSARLHGAHLDADAAARAAALRAHDTPPARATASSDPFPLGLTLVARSQAAIARQLGDDFANAVAALPARRWSAPIASPYGLHVVRVDERQPPALLPLAAVRRQVRLAVEEERAEARLHAALTELRARWTVRVEWEARP